MNFVSFQRTAGCSADSSKSWRKTTCWSLRTTAVDGYARFQPRTLLRRWMNSGKDFPEFEAILAMTARCGARLSAVLTGQTDPLRLLFPAGDLTTAEKIYQDSPSARTLNPLVREAIQAAVNAWPADRPIRILEVGAGTGGTTAHVLPALPLGRAHYLFTDLSPLFLARAKAKFADFQNVSFQLLNLEDDLSAQGLSSNSFDIIIASNVIHATADVTRTLASMRRLLAPGGWLLMLEVTRPQRWFDITFGLTDGWWRFRDHDLRTRYPLLSRAEWKRLLLANRFRAHPDRSGNWHRKRGNGRPGDAHRKRCRRSHRRYHKATGRHRPTLADTGRSPRHGATTGRASGHPRRSLHVGLRARRHKWILE